MFRKTALTVTFFGSLLFATYFNSPIAVANEQPVATEQLTFTVGEVRRIFLGVATLEVEVLQVGTDGWLLVEFEEDAPGFSIDQGDRYWVNTKTIWMISEES